MAGIQQSMGESTRRRLADVVRSAKNEGVSGNNRGGALMNIGGYKGGGAGTWGRAPTGRGDAKENFAGTSDDPRQPQVNLRPTSGRRVSIQRNSQGAKSAWDSCGLESRPGGIDQTQFISKRPHSASFSRKPPHENVDEPHQCAVPLKGQGLMRSSTISLDFPTTEHQKKGYKSQQTRPASCRLRESALKAQKAWQRRPSSSNHAHQGICPAHITRMEQEIREALKAHRTVYESEKDLLRKLFRDVDDGSGEMNQSDFCSMMDHIGVPVSSPEADAFFAKHGHYNGYMPHAKFVNTLIKQPKKQMADELQVRRGAFIAGEEADFCGRIVYPQCRSSVYTPSDWQPEIAERSGSVPEARLMLDYVYGYAGLDNTSQNLFFTSCGRVAYYTAGIGIVMGLKDHCQQFFLGHNDDIKSMAICPHGIKYNDIHYPSQSLFATGQVTSRGGGAYVCIWDSRPGEESALPEIARIQFEKEDRGIISLAFSPNGKKLVCIAMDNSHTVYVFDWRKGIKLSEGKGFTGEPPQVYGSLWDPFITDQKYDRFASHGKKHIKLWYSDGETRLYRSSQLTFGKLPMQNVHSVAFLPPKSPGEHGDVVAGMAGGEIYIFQGKQALKSIPAHKPGPKITAPDGSITFGGVRGMKLCGEQQDMLVTGGADGAVLFWDVKSGALSDTHSEHRALQLGGGTAIQEKPPAVRAIDCGFMSSELYIGTNGCDIWRITAEKQEILVHGHSGDLYSLCWHPCSPGVFATASDCSWLCVWDAHKKDIVLSVYMGFSLRAVGFSAAPGPHTDTHHIAVGGAKGRLKVVNEADLSPVFTARDVGQGIADLKYSPDNRYLAVASFDTFVDIYNVSNGYSRVCRCVGHSATVRHLDWSSDSNVLKSNCSAYEILYWNPKTGKQVKLSQRDTEWETWTCVLGFPVMGIWPDGSDGTDINACARACNGEYLVTSDDNGLVKLFNYPCVVEDAPYRAYRGHSSHVMCVRFNANDTLVNSAGGKDRAIFQFKFVLIEQEPVPQPEPPLQWGPIDASGKSVGWIRTKPKEEVIADEDFSMLMNGGTDSSPNGELSPVVTHAENQEEETEDEKSDGDEDAGWG